MPILGRSGEWFLETRHRRLHFCYGAGPTGYGLYRQIIAMGHACTVVAPSLIPKRPGDRVKTNRRDGMQLARLLRADELTAVWVPDETHEAVRELIRSREAAVDDLRRRRQSISSMMLRVCPEGSYGITKLSQHQANRRQVNECHRVAGQVLPVLGQPAAAIEPRECPFDDPSPGENLKPLSLIRALHDLDRNLRQQLCQSSAELRPLVSGISEQFRQEREQPKQAG